MFIRTGFKIAVECQTAVPMILAVQSHAREHDRMIGTDEVETSRTVELDRFMDGFGNRRIRLTAPAGTLTLSSDCLFRDEASPDFRTNARQHPVGELPHEVLPYLTASRFCESDSLTAPAWQLFGDTPESAERVQAITDFVHESVAFAYEPEQPSKTALEVMREGRGTSRDSAHLAIALCRAMNIPARYASGYLAAPELGPGDFHAWFEVFLGGRWHTCDARHDVARGGRVLMARGRDAADVPTITAFGAYTLKQFEVWAEEAKPHLHTEIHAPGIADVRPSSAWLEAAQ